MANWGLYFRGSNVFGWRRLVPKIPSARALLEGTERKLLRGIDTKPKDWDLAPKAWFERDLEKLAFRTLASEPPPKQARPPRRTGPGLLGGLEGWSAGLEKGFLRPKRTMFRFPW